jgi:hypothetical protein
MLPLLDRDRRVDALTGFIRAAGVSPDLLDAGGLFDEPFVPFEPVWLKEEEEGGERASE